MKRLGLFLLFLTTLLTKEVLNPSVAFALGDRKNIRLTCSQILSLNPKPSQVQLIPDSREDVLDILTQVSDMIFSNTIFKDDPGVKAQIDKKITELLGADLVLLDLKINILHREHPELLAEYRTLMTKLTLVGSLRPVDGEIYNNPEIWELYHTHFSLLQRIFSMTLVSYIWARTQFFLPHTPTIVDLGAGMGDTTLAILEFFPWARITATDLHPYNFPTVQSLSPGQIETVLNDFKKDELPFEDESVDAFISVAAVSQYLDPDDFMRFLKKAYRKLKPGGYLVFESGVTSHFLPKGVTLQEYLSDLTYMGFFTEKEPGVEINIGSSKYLPIMLVKTGNQLPH